MYLITVKNPTFGDWVTETEGALAAKAIFNNAKTAAGTIAVSVAANGDLLDEFIHPDIAKETA